MECAEQMLIFTYQSLCMSFNILVRFIYRPAIIGYYSLSYATLTQNKLLCLYCCFYSLFENYEHIIVGNMQSLWKYNNNIIYCLIINY